MLLKRDIKDTIIYFKQTSPTMGWELTIDAWGDVTISGHIKESLIYVSCTLMHTLIFGRYNNKPIEIIPASIGSIKDDGPVIIVGFTSSAPKDIG